MNAIGKMFDTQKEWIGWIFAGTTVWVVVQVAQMAAPQPVHMELVKWLLFTTVALVSAKALVDIVNAVKGIRGPG